MTTSCTAGSTRAKASYQITMGAGRHALFSAAGVGGLVLTYWALRKAGMPRRRSACRMVASSFALLGLPPGARCSGSCCGPHVLPGPAPVRRHDRAGSPRRGVMAIFLLIALIPQDFERRIQQFAGGYRRSLPAAPRQGTGDARHGTRTALAYIRHPSRGAVAVGGAVGFWAANIAVLWASFEAFGGDVPFGVLVQGFFVGLAANLIPSPAGGVGSVDAGMIFAFDVLFGLPSAVVFPAVLLPRDRLLAADSAGIVAFFQLRGTVAQWERERDAARWRGYTSESKVMSAYMETEIKDIENVVIVGSGPLATRPRSTPRARI